MIVLLILLKNPWECFDKLSMNGKFLTLTIPSPFVLRLSKDERGVFQHNSCVLLIRHRSPHNFLRKPLSRSSLVKRES